MIDTEILQDYTSEARELLEEMEGSLIRLEKEGSSAEHLNTIFRAVHCIKGSAEYVGLERSGTLTHAVESLLDRLRQGIIKLRPPVVDLLFRAKDLVTALVDEIAAEQEERSDIAPLMRELSEILARAGVGAEELTGEEALPDVPLEEFPEDEPEPPVVQEFEAEESPFDSEFSVDQEVPTTEMEFPGGPVPPDSEIVPELTAEHALLEDELLPVQEPTVEEPAPTPIEAFSAGATMEETVPHVLNLGLYLDDLEDGLSLVNVGTSILETVEGLKKSLSYVGQTEAIYTLDELRDRLLSYPRTEGRLPLDKVKELRSLVHDLHSFYPPDTFPSEEPTLPEPEVTPTEEVPLVPQAFLEAMRAIAGVDASIAEALHEAGFTSVELLGEADFASLMGVPGMKRSTAEAILESFREVTVEETKKTPPPRRPAEKSMLADVDEDLLREFEEAFGEEEVLEAAEREGSPRGFPAERPGFLLEQLDTIGQEADREILEIFLSYGWEITEKILPAVDKINKRNIGRNDLDVCAEYIKSMRSSSSYMDYQKLAAFLDDWYEKTLWASEMMESIVPEELDFMEEKINDFRAFLRGVEEALKPAVPVEIRPEPQIPEPEIPMVKPVAPPAKTIEKPIPKVERPAVTPQATPKPPQVTAEAKPAHEAPKAPVPPTPPPLAEPALAAAPERKEPRKEAPPDAEIAMDSPVVRTMRVDAAKVDLLLNQVGELVVNRSYVEQLSLELKMFQRELQRAREVGKKEIQALRDITLRVGEASISLGRAATELQEGVMKLRMLPVGQLFNRMPRLIRDLSRREGKAVNLRVQGGDTEVDKRVIEQVYNPLVHLIRNAVDHGIEDGETRKAAGKSPEGIILLNAYSQGNQVVIDVEDDGAGIDGEAVVEKAISLGLVDPKEAKSLSTQEIHALLFRPGFSTSAKVTRTSGRGVGMDVVKRDVEKINGTIEIESWIGQGTRISLKIPLTLAIIQTLLIRSIGQMYAIPLVSVREIVQISPEEISTIEGFQVVKFRDETIPILRIDEVFEVKQRRSGREPRFLVLATTGFKSVGFYVEELIGEQDVVIKPLAEHVWKTRGLAGSSILGDGTIALVLDVAELVEDIIARQRQLIMGGPRPAANGELGTNTNRTVNV